MIELITGLFSGGTGFLAAIGAALAGVVAIFLAGRRSGANAEKVKGQKQELQRWKEANDAIQKAGDARRNSRFDDLMSDDGFKRPKR